MKKLMLIAAVISTSFISMAQTNNKEEDAIRTVIKTVETGWIEKSGEKYASAFSEVHDYIVWNGYYFPNLTRQANADNHQNLFSGPFTNVDVKSKSIRSNSFVLILPLCIAMPVLTKKVKEHRKTQLRS